MLVPRRAAILALNLIVVLSASIAEAGPLLPSSDFPRVEGRSGLLLSPAAADEESIVSRTLLSRFVDYGIVVGGSAGLQLLTSRTLGAPSPQWFETQTWRLSAWTMLTMSVPLWTSFTLLDASPSGATPGKRLMGIRVVNDDGSGLSFPKSLLRTAFMFVGWDLAHVSMFIPTISPPEDPPPGSTSASASRRRGFSPTSWSRS